MKKLYSVLFRRDMFSGKVMTDEEYRKSQEQWECVGLAFNILNLLCVLGGVIAFYCCCLR